MKIYYLLPILLVVFISGCTQTATQDPLRGVTITSFTADSQVRSGDFVLLDLEVENIGGTTARNAQVDLFGVEGQWLDSFGNLIGDTQTKMLNTLKPPLLERNIPGDFKMVQWQLRTRDIPQGISPNLQIEARVTYDYNTSGFLLMPAISIDEFERQRILDQKSSFTAEAMNSQGPIHLDIPAKYIDPIILDFTESETEIIRPFRFEFVNVGDGFPITPEDDLRIRGPGGKLSGTIDVFGPGVSFSDCLGVTSGTHVDLDNSEITVKLRENNKVPIACSVSINKDQWGDRPTDTIQFEFNIFYRYYVPQTVTINVIGAR